jgi:hypothetical protein
MLKKDERSRNVYENKQISDNVPGKKSDIYVLDSDILYKRKRILQKFRRNRWLICQFSSATERIPRFKMYKPNGRASCSGSGHRQDGRGTRRELPRASCPWRSQSQEAMPQPATLQLRPVPRDVLETKGLTENHGNLHEIDVIEFKQVMVFLYEATKRRECVSKMKE